MTKEEMIEKFNKNNQLRKNIIYLLNTIPKLTKERFNEKERFMNIEGNNVIFPDKSTKERISQLKKVISEYLGPKFEDEKKILTYLVEVAFNNNLKNNTEKLEKFIHKITYGMEFIECKCDNYLFFMDFDQNEIKIGPVRICINENAINDELAVQWIISIQSSRPNLQKESHWMVNIAISLLRLSYEDLLKEATSKRCPYPDLGTIEAMPTRPTTVEQDFIPFNIYNQNRLPDCVNPRKYNIDKYIVAATKSNLFIQRAKYIFTPPRDSLAERLKQGLGWLTRGRQSESESERLIFFFTAIESILSCDDKNVPVVHNIIKNSSAILGNTMPEIKKDIKELYDHRSTLLHQGKFNALRADVELSQCIAENLYKRVLDNFDISESFSSFQEKLR